MRIIVIHNKYQYPGGEEAVFQAESEMLRQHGNAVEQLIFDNKDIRGSLDKFLTGIRGLYNTKSARDLQDLIQRFRPDIIHVHNFFPVASPSVFFVAKRYNIPTVVTLHNFRLICPSGSLYYNGKIYDENVRSIVPWDGIGKGVYRNSRTETIGLAAITVFHNIFGTWMKKIDKFIVLSEFARKKFSESALRASYDQFVVKPNFVDDFGHNEAAREDFFLIASRLSAEKGIDIALKALTSHKFKLVVIGDGPLKERVMNAAKSNPDITYLGFQKKEVVIDYLKRCTALLLPSVCYEGFPVSLLESFATGTPVIASRLGSLAEIVQDQKNGLHFAPGNAEDLSDKMAILARDRVLAARLGANARTTYLDNYTPERNYYKLMDIYTPLANAGVSQRYS